MEAARSALPNVIVKISIAKSFLNRHEKMMAVLLAEAD
jgi:hypothetical protein